MPLPPPRSLRATAGLPGDGQDATPAVPSMWEASPRSARGSHGSARRGGGPLPVPQMRAACCRLTPSWFVTKQSPDRREVLKSYVRAKAEGQTRRQNLKGWRKRSGKRQSCSSFSAFLSSPQATSGSGGRCWLHCALSFPPRWTSRLPFWSLVPTSLLNDISF